MKQKAYNMEHLNSHLKDRYKRIEERIIYLRNQILNESNNMRRNQRRSAEVSALEWALRIVLKYYDEHPMENDNLKPCEDCIRGINPGDGMPCVTCGGTGEIIIPPRIRKEKYEPVL